MGFWGQCVGTSASILYFLPCQCFIWDFGVSVWVPLLVFYTSYHVSVSYGILGSVCGDLCKYSTLPTMSVFHMGFWGWCVGTSASILYFLPWQCFIWDFGVSVWVPLLVFYTSYHVSVSYGILGSGKGKTTYSLLRHVCDICSVQVKNFFFFF